MIKNKIELVYMKNNSMFEVIPPNLKRKWMDDTKGHAYRCIPLNVANTYGWTVLSPVGFSATWDGGSGAESIDITIIDDKPDGFEDLLAVSSHFGHGVITFNPDFIVRTSKNISLYVRGVPNSIPNGIQPLDAIVETDWLPFTFTYNFKFTKPGTATFSKGQPIFTFFPIERGFIESFKTTVSEISEDKEFQEEYSYYCKFRDKQNSNIENGKENELGTYGKAKSIFKKYDVINHAKKISLGNFKKESDG
jgi:hypothetical protein